MKAIALSAYGDVGKLEFRDYPEPKAGPNELKVKMAGASINPIDLKLRSGAYQSMMPLEFPAVLGRDASGTVVEVGPGVKRFQVGARVLGLVNHGYAQFVVASVDAWAAVPSTMDLVEAGALPLVLLTGAQLVEECLKPTKGNVVLVTGATGSVGRAALFTAKLLGAKVWAGVRRAQVVEASMLGAEGVVAIDEPEDLARLPRLDGIADTVGGETLARLFDRVKTGGVIASVLGEAAGAREAGLIPRGMFAHADGVRLAQLALAVAGGRLLIPIAQKFPLAKAGEAQTLAEHHVRGKVMLVG